MNQSFFLIGIGFVTPAFAIAGVALISIPIIIHILNRRRFKTVPWAAMEFLLRALRKNRRRLKFEQWLLLATRCAVLLLAALALARPVGCEQTTVAALAGSRSGLHVIVIDNSYSTGYQADRPEARTHLDQAKRLATQLIDRLDPGGESVVVIAASRPSQAVIASPTYDLDAARSTIERLELSAGATDLPGALQAALAIGQDESRQPRRHLYLLTDGTRSAWEGQGVTAPLRELGPQLAQVFDVAHFNLGRPNQWNHAVLNVRPGANLVTSKFSTDVIATLGGYGGSADAQLQWRLDDQVLPGGGNVQVAGETEVFQAAGSFRGGGFHVVSVELETDDRLPVDDLRHRVVNVASALKVLIVEGERGLQPMQGSAAFLALALAPPTDPGSGGNGGTSSYVQPEVISDLELGNRVLNDYRAVILAGVGQIQPAQADQLRLFVEQGGTLMLFMGDAVSSDNYNTTLLPRVLLPGPLARHVRVTSDQDAFHFDFKPGAEVHPLLREFRNHERSGLDTAQIFSYWQLDLAPEAHAERVLSFLPTGAGEDQRQDPAITVHAVGDGQVVFVATAADADPDWSFLPAKPAYVALVHELLSGSINAGDRWLNLLVGEALQIPSTLRLTSAPVLLDPSKRDVPIDQRTGEQGRPIYHTRPLTVPGIYSLSAGSQTYPIAVNVPPEEADIRTLDATTIQKALGGIEIAQHDDQLPPETTGAASADDGNDYGWTIMLVVLALVGFEAFLAMRFAHYRRP